MTMGICNTGCPYIDNYLRNILAGTVPSSAEMKLAATYIPGKLSDPDVYIDTAMTEKAIELIERYFGYTLLDWERFIIALVHCYYRTSDTVVFSEFLIMMGRGNGKNGFISGLAWYLTTRYHGVKGYNVDIIANAEDQAKISFDDIYEVLERTWVKSKRFFYKSKELIKNLDTGSYVKFNTSNAKTKDGKRSACLIFDEIHEYENSASIRVFRSGFGKRKHSRTFYITTNGYVRDGVLDRRLEIAMDTLRGERSKSRLCPLIYKLDSDEEVEDPENWVKANPSLPYMQTLRLEMDQANIDRMDDNDVALDFFTKRMNLPRSDREVAITDWKNIAATNRPLPDLAGWSCTAGIDYASLKDWAAVNLHFRRGNERFDLNHSWLCLRSSDLTRIKAPWQEWEEQGHVTVVDDVEIAPELLTEYLLEQAQRYNIVKVALDNFRYALLKNALEKIGFSASVYKNVWLVQPSGIMKVQPVIDSCFNNQYFTWGNCPPLRWAANNTKLMRSGRKEGTDTGNFYYAKIEAHARKTDPFMGLVASMVIEDALGGGYCGELPSLGVITG